MKKIAVILFLALGCKPQPKAIVKEDVYQMVFSDAKEIEQIRTAIYDSLVVWKRDKVKRYNLASFVKVKIDTLICLNAKKDKLITCKLRSPKTVHPFDGIIYFYGVKIKGRWYFFDGPALVIARKDDHIPNTFEQLSKKAYQEVFRSYLKRNKEGNLEIDDNFFADLTSGAWYGSLPYPHNKETWDERYLEIVSEARAKIDTSDYSKLK